MSVADAAARAAAAARETMLSGSATVTTKAGSGGFNPATGRHEADLDTSDPIAAVARSVSSSAAGGQAIDDQAVVVSFPVGTVVPAGALVRMVDNPAEPGLVGVPLLVHRVIAAAVVVRAECSARTALDAQAWAAEAPR